MPDTVVQRKPFQQRNDRRRDEIWPPKQVRASDQAAQSNQEPKDRRNRPIRCYKCNQTGHIAKDCRYGRYTEAQGRLGPHQPGETARTAAVTLVDDCHINSDDTYLGDELLGWMYETHGVYLDSEGQPCPQLGLQWNCRCKLKESRLRPWLIQDARLLSFPDNYANRSWTTRMDKKHRIFWTNRDVEWLITFASGSQVCDSEHTVALNFVLAQKLPFRWVAKDAKYRE